MRIHWGKWGRWPHLPQFLEFTWGLCWVGVSWDLRVTHPLRVGRFYLDLALPRWSTGGCHSWNRLLLSVQPSCGRNSDSYVEFCIIYFQLLLTSPKQLSALADRFKKIEQFFFTKKKYNISSKYLFKLVVYSKNVSLRLQSSFWQCFFSFFNPHSDTCLVIFSPLKVFDTWYVFSILILIRVLSYSPLSKSLIHDIIASSKGTAQLVLYTWYPTVCPLSQTSFRPGFVWG